MRRTGPSRKSVKELANALERKGRKEKVKLWLKLAERLNAPTRKRVFANISDIQRVGRLHKGKIILVAGKVLGNGKMDESLKVIALQYSKSAKLAIEAGKGRAFTIEEALGEKVSPKEVVWCA
ncbi:MAG: 50S ribosomal protein L18e [Candidatus Diapherotrites archaeon]